MTVRQLLEHTSGINANAFRNEVAIRDAHKAAVPNGSWHLPVTAEMCDAYIASLDMGAKDPGQAMAYNNCGYYLLGRVVAKKRGQARPIDAFQDHLFDPSMSAYHGARCQHLCGYQHGGSLCSHTHTPTRIALG